MKEIVKSIVLLIVIYLLLFFLVKTNRQSQTKQPEPKTITVTDTLTQVIYDTIFIDHFEIVKLPTTDTTVYYLTDTVKRVDSVFVEVPISVYKFDSTFTSDTTRLDLFIQNKGYNVKLDSLSYYFEYTPRPQRSNYLKEHFKFGLGVSTGFGVFSKKPDVFIGFGFYYCF